VIVVSHFDRPKGKRVPAMSLRPMSHALRDVLGRDVFFADDCVGPVAEQAGGGAGTGQVLVLENTRFHAGEETNDPDMARRAWRRWRYLCQRRVLRRPPRACQHRGRGAPLPSLPGG
jgi:3-phosphoglycerate kinase